MLQGNIHISVYLLKKYKDKPETRDTLPMGGEWERDKAENGSMGAG